MHNVAPPSGEEWLHEIKRLPRELDLRWHACRVHNFGGPLWIIGAKTVGGMSGSPIIDKDGRAIGVVCTGGESENIKGYDGPHTHLMRSLPRSMTPMR